MSHEGTQQQPAAFESTAEIERFIERYGQAWAAHDVDTILSMHTDDTVLAVRGLCDTHGLDELREELERQFDTWPDLLIEPYRSHLTPEVAIVQATVAATPRKPLHLADGDIPPANAKVRWELVDLITLEGGLLKRKDCFVDFSAYRKQSPSPVALSPQSGE